jgi:hypothetical protein
MKDAVVPAIGQLVEYELYNAAYCWLWMIGLSNNFMYTLSPLGNEIFTLLNVILDNKTLSLPDPEFRLDEPDLFITYYKSMTRMDHDTVIDLLNCRFSGYELNDGIFVVMNRQLYAKFGQIPDLYFHIYTYVKRFMYICGYTRTEKESSTRRQYTKSVKTLNRYFGHDPDDPSSNQIPFKKVTQEDIDRYNFNPVPEEQRDPRFNRDVSLDEVESSYREFYVIDPEAGYDTDENDYVSFKNELTASIYTKVKSDVSNNIDFLLDSEGVKRKVIPMIKSKGSGFKFHMVLGQGSDSVHIKRIPTRVSAINKQDLFRMVLSTKRDVAPILYPSLDDFNLRWAGDNIDSDLYPVHLRLMYMTGRCVNGPITGAGYRSVMRKVLRTIGSLNWFDYALHATVQYLFEHILSSLIESESMQALSSNFDASVAAASSDLRYIAHASDAEAWDGSFKFFLTFVAIMMAISDAAGGRDFNDLITISDLIRSLFIGYNGLPLSGYGLDGYFIVFLDAMLSGTFNTKNFNSYVHIVLHDIILRSIGDDMDNDYGSIYKTDYYRVTGDDLHEVKFLDWAKDSVESRLGYMELFREVGLNYGFSFDPLGGFMSTWSSYLMKNYGNGFLMANYRNMYISNENENVVSSSIERARAMRSQLLNGCERGFTISTADMIYVLFWIVHANEEIFLPKRIDKNSNLPRLLKNMINRGSGKVRVRVPFISMALQMSRGGGGFWPRMPFPNVDLLISYHIVKSGLNNSDFLRGTYSILKDRTSFTVIDMLTEYLVSGDYTVWTKDLKSTIDVDLIGNMNELMIEEERLELRDNAVNSGLLTPLPSNIDYANRTVNFFKQSFKSNKNLISIMKAERSRKGISIFSSRFDMVSKKKLNKDETFGIDIEFVHQERVSETFGVPLVYQTTSIEYKIIYELFGYRSIGMVKSPIDSMRIRRAIEDLDHGEWPREYDMDRMINYWIENYAHLGYAMAATGIMNATAIGGKLRNFDKLTSLFSTDTNFSFSSGLARDADLSPDRIRDRIVDNEQGPLDTTKIAMIGMVMIEYAILNEDINFGVIIS